MRSDNALGSIVMVATMLHQTAPYCERHQKCDQIYVYQCHHLFIVSFIVQSIIHISFYKCFYDILYSYLGYIRVKGTHRNNLHCRRAKVPKLNAITAVHLTNTVFYVFLPESFVRNAYNGISLFKL